MALNYIWIFFFLVAFVVALARLIFFQDYDVFPNILQSTFDMAKTGFELSIYLTGVMAFWLGIMKIGEEGGIIHFFSKLIKPFFSKLFPGIPDDHPATASMIMNFSANMLGLDNAATPLGLKTMKEMQEINPVKDTASDAQIMFLVLNTSGLSIIPLTILIDRSVVGSSNPTDVFIPIMLATFFSTLIGLIVVSLYQKINLLDKVVLTYLGGISLFMAGIIIYFSLIPQEQIATISNVASSLIIFSVIVGFILLAVIKRVNVYEAFIDGAKEGFTIAVKIIPYLVAILVAIGVFRAAGALDYIIQGVSSFVSIFGVNTEFVQALPTALMKPLSGSAARGMNIEIMKTFGPDSFVGQLSSVFRGATETTFYILAVYFGSVNIKKTRYAVTAGLLADLAGIIAGLFIGYLFFH
ncbi:MAG: spore maturation protein [bacterium]|nr:MAG: spore maturation protein [bacterium]